MSSACVRQSLIRLAQTSLLWLKRLLLSVRKCVKRIITYFINTNRATNCKFNKLNILLESILTSTDDSPLHRRITKKANDKEKSDEYILMYNPTRNPAAIIKFAKYSNYWFDVHTKGKYFFKQTAIYPFNLCIDSKWNRLINNKKKIYTSAFLVGYAPAVWVK